MNKTHIQSALFIALFSFIHIVVMSSITVIPSAKINLGLYIQGKLPNGYHQLETLMYPLDAPADRMTVSEKSEAGCHLTMTGRPIAGNIQDNLVVKAYAVLKQRFPELPGVSVTLAKRIPAGAGLGGGSSDAAALIKACWALFELDMSIDELAELAAPLGADVPFFIYQKPMLATGTGTTLESFEVDLRVYRLELICPPIHSSTVAAYQSLALSTLPQGRNLKADLGLPVFAWRDRLTNDLEISVMKKFPKIAEIKAELYARGAVYASMSGSGSAVFGLFTQ